MYLTRIELHNATYLDYNTLHSAMEGKGFSRTVTGSDNVVYNLPTAEYYYNGNSNIDQVLTAAKAAANSTGKTSAVIVANATELKWNGLSRA